MAAPAAARVCRRTRRLRSRCHLRPAHVSCSCVVCLPARCAAEPAARGHEAGAWHGGRHGCAAAAAPPAAAAAARAVLTPPPPPLLQPLLALLLQRPHCWRCWRLLTPLLPGVPAAAAASTPRLRAPLRPHLQPATRCHPALYPACPPALPIASLHPIHHQAGPRAHGGGAARARVAAGALPLCLRKARAICGWQLRSCSRGPTHRGCPTEAQPACWHEHTPIKKRTGSV